MKTGVLFVRHQTPLPPAGLASLAGHTTQIQERPMAIYETRYESLGFHVAFDAMLDIANIDVRPETFFVCGAWRYDFDDSGSRTLKVTRSPIE
jgi:hypothetical protein